MRNTADVTGGKPIAFLLQSISGVSAINPLVVFYDIHGGKREALFFFFVLDYMRLKKRHFHHHHHQRINVPTAKAEPSLTNGLTCLLKHGGP
jgi:hypothetical protein